MMKKSMTYRDTAYLKTVTEFQIMVRYNDENVLNYFL